MGTVFAIKRYAIHDGPDIRTTIFLKGCPLSCRWCHNPEGMSPLISMLWSDRRCIGCGDCIEKCPSGSLSRSGDDLLRDPGRCLCCGRCAEICPALAHEATGWEASVADIMAEIGRDLPFYDQSGGGVTFSGGEPLLQAEFLIELLQACGRMGIHRAVDTCAYVAQATLLEVARHTDLFLVDIKHMDSDKHRYYTGVGNDRILSNIQALAELGKALHIRLPLIEGVNGDDDNLRRSGAFIAALKNVETVDILPYHGAAAVKYARLGLAYPGEAYVPMTQQKLTHCVDLLTSMGLKVQLGG
jgi:pyruvate formate lyase activating enzyme